MSQGRTFFLVVALLGVAANVPAARIAVVCVNAPDCKVSGHFVLKGAADSAPRRIAIADDIAGTWDVELDASGYWMPRQHIVFSADTATTVQVWRTTQLRGRFSGNELPHSFVLAFESAPGTSRPAIPRSSLDCPVNDDGSWTCAVPATALDIVVRAKPFTPHYLWDVRLQPDVPADLGKIALKQGASLVAWLDSSTAKSLSQPAKATLTMMTMAGSPTLGDRLNRPVAEGAFNRRGAVQLAPVPPGTYTLEVSAPGFAPEHLDQITIYERSESVLRAPIKLGPPLNVRFLLKPPNDPSGSAWRLNVERAAPLTFRRSNVAEGAATNGAFDVAGQAPGRYVVVVQDQHGNVYANRELEIHGQADAERTIEIGVLTIHGTVRLAGQPIAASLFFGGRNGAERIRATADDSGAFRVTLPHAGKWTVDVESTDVAAAIAATVSGDELTLDLPDTEVGGWVSGLDGKRVPGAVVTLYTSAGPLNQQSEADGTFRFRGISAGTARINASNPRTAEYSRFLEIPVADGVHRQGIELALQNMATLKGVVVSQGQPLVGARVTGYGFGGGMARQERAITGLDGKFDLLFPGSATEIALIVSAPGRVLQAFSTRPTDAAVTLDVSSAGGTLRLHMPAGASRPGITYNGTPIPMPEVLQWAQAQNASPPSGEFFNIPNIAPGAYRFCVARGAGDVCRDGTLVPGSVLVLEP